MSEAVTKSSKRRHGSPGAGSPVRLPTLDKNIHAEPRSANGRMPKRATYKSREINGTLLRETSEALGHAGIARSDVFTRAAVSSYSIDPADPTRIIRERSDGKISIGRLVAGRFRVLTRK